MASSKDSEKKSIGFVIKATVILLFTLVVSYIVLTAICGPKPMDVTYEEIEPILLSVNKLRNSIIATDEENELMRSLQEKINDTHRAVGSSSQTIKSIDNARVLLTQLSNYTSKNRSIYAKKLKQLQEAKIVYITSNEVNPGKDYDRDTINSLLLSISDLKRITRDILVLDEHLSEDLSYVVNQLDLIPHFSYSLESSDTALADSIHNLLEIQQNILHLFRVRAEHSARVWEDFKKLDESIRAASEIILTPWTYPELSQKEQGAIWIKITRRLEPIFNQIWPWPFTFTLVLLLTLQFGIGKEWVVKILTRIKVLRIADIFELTFDPEIKEEIEADMEAILRKSKKAIMDKYDQEVRERGIASSFNKICADSIKPWLEGKVTNKDAIESLRCTVHVPYALLDRTLYQLVDYWPPQSKGKGGRTLSQRFGIIGIAFRTETPNLSNEIPVEPKVLVEQWGMQWQEAERKNERQSMIAIPLKNDSDKVIAVVYLDSLKRSAFQSSDGDESIVEAIDAEISSAFRKNGLLPEIDKLVQHMRKQIPQVAIHD